MITLKQLLETYEGKVNIIVTTHYGYGIGNHYPQNYIDALDEMDYDFEILSVTHTRQDYNEDTDAYVHTFTVVIFADCKAAAEKLCYLSNRYAIINSPYFSEETKRAILG